MAGSFRRAQTGPGKSKQVGRGRIAGQVRIIAGRWRGRKLNVPDVNGLRPTGDRVRETLFNWLQGRVAGSHCLDLFAGSGALGFEALSRYARTVTLVEPDGSAYQNLVQSCQLLDIPVAAGKVAAMATPEDLPPTACLYAGTAQEAIGYWSQCENAPRYDLVFIDPPFDLDYQWTVLLELAPDFLSDDALVYIESPTAQAPPDSLPRGFETLREKRFGDVTARLLSFSLTR
ncbi:MAG: 16S rRNA (guanine(966)-N(2))-methyltransferase RsmD [Granulosicoccus sp.]